MKNGKPTWPRVQGAAAALCAALAGTAGAQGLVFDGNILFGNTTTYHAASGGLACTGGAYTTTQLATVKFTRNGTGNPLINPAVTNLAGPRWDLQAGSAALGKWGAQVMRASQYDPWFTDVCYAGGVGQTNGDPAQDWTTGWTYYNQAGGTGRTDIDFGKATVMVMANIAANTNWTNANNYMLVGRIAVQAGATLTIQPGTVIFGNTGVLSYLVIERGARIDAQGTALQPIIFTSGSPLGSMATSDWGGLVIHGQAVANCSGTMSPRCGLTDNTNACVSEGDTGALFGGSNDDDDSGILRYVRVEYAGREIAPNNELNAFTFNAVGRTTRAEFLQAFKGSDDSFEWFGGSARARWLVAVDGGDDMLDWQMGYRGFVQFAVTSGGAINDRGIEADNNEFCFNGPGRSNPVIANITLVTQQNALNSPGIHLRRGTSGTIINSIIQGFPVGLRLEHEETFANCAGATPQALVCETSGAGPEGRGDFTASAGRVGDASISFAIPEAAHVTVRLYDAAGRLVETLANAGYTPGTHTVEWAQSRRRSGAFFYKVDAGTRSASGRLVVLR